MKNILAIDIGNTNITAGIFRSGRLVGKTKIPTSESSSYGRRLAGLIKPSGLAADERVDIVISSVVPSALKRLARCLDKVAPNNKVVILGKTVKVPIRNLYRKKLEVGQDRLVNAFAARILYGAPCVIVDFGTAITFDVVSGKGEYLGGLILPGVELSLRGLYEKTALLPKVELRKAPHIIGKDTANSMRGGILFGFGAMCDGLVARYRNMLGKDLRVIATGGNARLMKLYAKSIQKVNSDLTLQGLRLISEKIARDI